MKATLVGGGNSAHVLAVLLAGRGHSVTVLTHRPTEWSSELELDHPAGTLHGHIHSVTSDPKEAMANADVAFLCMPVHQYPSGLHWILPGLAMNPDCMFGPLYGQAGFNWMVQKTAKESGIPLNNYFAIGMLPWIARTQTYGKRVACYGGKLRNCIACSNDGTFRNLNSGILNDFSFSYTGKGAFERVPNFITLTLTVDNQIIHPSRCFGLAHEAESWASEESVPFFYRDFDQFSADIQMGVDSDCSAVRRKLVSLYPTLDNHFMMNYLEFEHWLYGFNNPDIRTSFVTSTRLRDLKSPVVKGNDGRWRIDVQYRYFKDDFAFGLDIVNWFARQLAVPVPHITKIIDWYERDIVPRIGTRLIPATPEYYGLTLEQSLG